MDRRKLLLVAAAVVAALGAALVFMYVQGAEGRAEKQFDTVEVLTAKLPIEPGESIEAASRSGKLQIARVAQNQVLPGAMSGIQGLEGQNANTRIYPGEQIVPEKFAAGASAGAASLQIPEGQVAASVQLTDTARVAGFVNPGSKVAVFMNGTDAGTGRAFTRLLLPKVTVLGVGSTTPVSATANADGTQAEQLPSTMMTLALSQADAERVMFATSNGELVFTLLTDKSNVAPSGGTNAGNLFR